MDTFQSPTLTLNHLSELTEFDFPLPYARILYQESGFRFRQIRFQSATSSVEGVHGNFRIQRHFLFRTISISNSFQVRTLVNQYQRLLSPRRLVINDIYPNNRLLCRGGYTSLMLDKQLVTLSQL